MVAVKQRRVCSIRATLCVQPLNEDDTFTDQILNRQETVVTCIGLHLKETKQIKISHIMDWM